jgi:hypothetical protein
MVSTTSFEVSGWWHRARLARMARLGRSFRRLTRASRSASPRLAPALKGERCYRVEIKPPVVTTIQRLPQRVIESIRPNLGT